MTEDEAKELRELESAEERTPKQLDRLYWLRLRAAGACTNAELLEQIKTRLDDIGRMAVMPLHTRILYGWTSTGSGWVPTRNGCQAECYTRGSWDYPKISPWGDRD